MNIEDIRQKYQRDASQTFAQWKDWVRKNKPSQAQAHVVKAVAPNGGNYERVFGGYTDAQNAASELVSHGYKDVKLFSSVNAGPLKLLRKFKDSVDAVDSIREKYCIDKRSDVLVYKVFDKNSNVVSQGELGVVNTIPWNDLRSKANSSGKQWKTISVFRKGERKAIDFINFIKNKESR